MSTIEKALDKLNQQSLNAATATPAPIENVLPAVDSMAAAVDPTPVIATIEAAAPVAAEMADVPEKKNVVSIDLNRLDGKSFVTLSTERRLIYEEFRVIKRKLINNAFGPLSSTLRHPNLIMVSSSRPAEGKTFTSVNLALSIALEQDKTVLLVDADVLRPNVSRTLEISLPLGLTDFLSSDKLGVTDVMYSTNVERLKIIAAGRPHHLSTEL